jgi:hypothetical protein
MWLAVVGLVPMPSLGAQSAAGTLPVGLAHCWFFAGASAPMDGCGGAGLEFLSGGAGNVVTAAGWAGGAAQRLVGTSVVALNGGTFAAPGQYGYEATDATVGSWGDGQAHTLAMLMAFDPDGYSSSRVQNASTVPLEKVGEYVLGVTAAGGGGMTLQVSGAGGSSSSLPAAAEPSAAMVAAEPKANPAGPWYLVTIGYDGRGTVCLWLNDSPNASCVSGVTPAQSAKPLRVGGSAYVEYLMEWNRALTAAERASLYASQVSEAAPYFSPQPTSGLTVLPLAGTGCMRGDGWRNKYGAGGYMIPNPFTTCTFETNAPVLYAEEVVLQNATGPSQTPAGAQIQVSLDNGVWGENPYAAVTPWKLGANRLAVGLPGDGQSHAVTIDVSGYVGYSGNSATPTTGMRAAVVTAVAVAAGYTLTAVTAPAPTNAWLFYTDSLGLGALTNYPETDGYVGQLRMLGGYPGDIELEAYGGRALYYDMPTTGAAVQFADTLRSRWGCPARFTAETMTNDYGGSLWTAAQGGQSMAAFWGEWNRVCPQTINVQQSAFLAAVETPNLLGDTLGQWRTAMAAACSAAKSCTNVDATASGYPGPGIACPGSGNGVGTGVGFASLGTDGLHLTSCGAAMARAVEFRQWTVGVQTGAIKAARK